MVFLLNRAAGILLLMFGEALVRPWMALMTEMAGVRTPSPMIMDVASSTTVSSRTLENLLPCSTAPTCMRMLATQGMVLHFLSSQSLIIIGIASSSMVSSKFQTICCPVALRRTAYN